jgi:hypothetical protein
MAVLLKEAPLSGYWGDPILMLTHIKVALQPSWMGEVGEQQLAL